MQDGLSIWDSTGCELQVSQAGPAICAQLRHDCGIKTAEGQPELVQLCPLALEQQEDTGSIKLPAAECKV
jgi:hypothetical protein